MGAATACPSADAMTAFLKANFDGPNHPLITEAETGRVALTLSCGPAELRPGGFISGPTMMAIADTAGLMGVFSHTGMTAPAFTTALSIDFLRPAKGQQLHAWADVVKFGRTLSVINVTLRGSDNDKPSAQAVVTYATGAKAG
ncbi:PaaI family thioesterase [Algimonas porphyrae]|uniref:Thioesterase n=1 Tax=Algimonas porphyrae TaxID=1128113 RepID=A0ABQ5V1N0_9PROT|nr:PaaI family thioesterase [Algimonas porphyrae]GLQ20982.1 thioesterase [Algimonas porphyrae]